MTGLEALGCANTKGEGQTVCVLSDSFDANGFVAGLQASGDLPIVDNILVGSSGGAFRTEKATSVSG